jgi:NAD+ kinase
LANGWSFAEIQENYPGIEEADIRACIAYGAEMSRERWPEVLERVLAGDFHVRRRLCLEYVIRRKDGGEESGLAVNDIVVSRGVLARLIRLTLSFDGEFVAGMRADGLVVSTPTGATAYGFSAGGPLIHPDLEVLSLTPVCPFLNSIKPLVLPAGGTLSILVEEAGDVNLSEDGQRAVPLAAGDEVLVRRSAHDLVLADLGETGYFSRLRSKGFVSGGGK